MPFPRLLKTFSEDCVVEENFLQATKTEREVNGVPDCKDVLACRYAVAICFVVITKLCGCVTQSSNYSFIRCNDVICVGAFIVTVSKIERSMGI